MSELAWSIPGAIPTATYRAGDPVWVRVAGASLPAVIRRVNAAGIDVMFYRLRRDLTQSRWVRQCRRVGSEVLSMRKGCDRIDNPRRVDRIRFAGTTRARHRAEPDNHGNDAAGVTDERGAAA